MRSRYFQFPMEVFLGRSSHHRSRSQADYYRSGRNIWHAAGRLGVEGGATAAGGVIGYQRGGFEGMITGAQIGQGIGSLAGNYLVACFTAGTPIMVTQERDSKVVGGIRKGDYLAARNEHDPNGPIELKRVEEVFERLAAVLELTVRGKIIGTTGEHPFIVKERGTFVPAGQLEVGQTFVGDDGQEAVIEGILATGEFKKVYNSRIEDFHTYFGSSGRRVRWTRGLKKLGHGFSKKGYHTFPGGSPCPSQRCIRF